MPEKTLKIAVNRAEQGTRLDRFLVCRVEGMSRAEARRLISAGKVQVNGKARVKGGIVASGEIVELAQLPAPERFLAAADLELKLRVLYQDQWLVVVEKPAGAPSCPLRPEERGTVAGALIARFPEMAEAGLRPQEAGLVHRLDAGTSGLMLAARSKEAFDKLRRALKEGRIEKRYLALCAGQVLAPQTIKAWLASSRSESRKVRVSARSAKRARPAVTEILQARSIGDLSLVEVRVPSAARHQIRAHLAWLGHPLAGDELYGGPPLAGLGRQFLHASGLSFTHPFTGKTVRVTSPLPSDLRDLERNIVPVHDG